MSEILTARDLVDPILVATLGRPRPDTVDAIVGVCSDALEATVGPEVLAALERQRHLVALVAPWVFDLARGLLVLERQGSGELPSSALLDLLSGQRLSEHDRERLAEAVDLTTTLTLDRVLEHVLGPGACAQDPLSNVLAAPWLNALKYGHRVHIALELLRLLPAS